MDQDLTAAREIIGHADRLLFLTGAGVSTASGIPDFRGPNGFWKDEAVAQLLTWRSFKARPDQVWSWSRAFRELADRAEPNPAHRSLAEYCQRQPATLVTQNIDGLHERLHPTFSLHGCIQRASCPECEMVYTEAWPYATRLPVPFCPRCGSALRPRIMFFDDFYAPETLEVLERLTEQASALVVVGASMVLTLPRKIAGWMVKRQKPIVEVNLLDTALTPYATVALRGAAAELLPQLLSEAA